MTTKVLLDTDIGSDIDDAVCLAYLLAQPECELLGITTVTGESEKRAMLASALCKTAGRPEVPIFPGAPDPLIVSQKQPLAPQASALVRWDHDSEFSEGAAVEFLSHTIREHPGEVTLLAIGPMTNVALLFHADPEIPALLKSLVMMCGVFTDRAPNDSGLVEWNALVDPHAAAVVYGMPVRVHRSVGLDATARVRMEAGEVRERFSGVPLLSPVLDLAEVWFREREEITFHDPLAATTIFDDRVCTFEKGSVSVELANEERIGKTHWQPDGTSHEVALDVDAERFFDHYLSVLEGTTPGA